MTNSHYHGRKYIGAVWKIKYLFFKKIHQRLFAKSLGIIRLLLPIQLDRAGDSVVFARENIILAQGKTFPVVRAQNSPQVRMSVEDNAEQVERLALMPIRRGPEIRDA